VSTPKPILVTGTLYDAEGNPSPGTVIFKNALTISHKSDDALMVADTRTIQAGPSGVFAIPIPSSNDPAWTPENWTWRITTITPEKTTIWYAVVPFDAPGNTIALGKLVPVVQGGGNLYAPYNHTHSDLVTDAELTAALAALPPGGVVSVNNQTGVVTLTAAQVGADPAGSSAVALAQANAARWAVKSPEDAGYCGWMYDPGASVQAGLVMPTGGLSHIFRFRATKNTISNLHMHFTAGGTGLVTGQCFMSLNSDAGAQLAISADQAGATGGSSNWSTSGYKTIPLVGGPVSVTPGAWYKARMWSNGTTGPTASRAVNSNTVITNAGLAAPNFWWSTADTGLTTAASAPANIGTMTGIATAWWLAAS
jgi:hypothetical protein